MGVANIVFSFNTGGIENLLVDIMNNWPLSENIMLCIINDEKNESLINKIRKNKNVKIICFDRKPKSGFLRTINIIWKLRKELKKYRIKIIHCHSNNGFKFVLPIKLFSLKTKIFLTIHNTDTYGKFSKFDKLLHLLFIKKIFAISKAVEKTIIHNGFMKKKVKIIYNGIDSKKFLSISKDEKNVDKKRIICVARVIPELKGQDILINAIYLLKKKRNDFECIIVGDYPKNRPEIKEKLNELVHKLKLEKDIKFLGNREDVPYLLKNSDLFVLPSRFEGFGIAVIEAMMSNIPVIGSNVDGLNEIIGNNKYGYLFKSEDYYDLFSVMNLVLNSDTEKLVERANLYSIEKFDIKIMINNLIKSYKE